LFVVLLLEWGSGLIVMEDVRVGVVDEDVVSREVTTYPYIHLGEQGRPCTVRNFLSIASLPGVVQTTIVSKAGSAAINTGIVKANIQLQRHIQLQC
jgi:hypothetical protein